MNDLPELTNQLVKNQKIKELANLILNKNKLIENFIDTNLLTKFNTISYKKYLTNKINEKIAEKFTNFQNLPTNLKELYFPSNNVGKYEGKIRDLIDQIAYPSIYDYRNKNNHEIITLAIQLNNEFGNPRLMIPIFGLEHEIKDYLLMKNQNSALNRPLKMGNKKTFLNYDQMEDLCKRIIFLVAGDKNNISDISKINNLKWNIFIKDKGLVNLKPYDFFMRNEKSSAWRELDKLPMKNLKLCIELDNSYIEVNLNEKNSEENNIQFFNKISEEYNHFLKDINNLVDLSNYKIIDEAFLEIKSDHQKWLLQLEDVFTLIGEKHNIENDLFQEIKNELPLLKKFQNWYQGNFRKESAEIKFIISLILKKLLEQNK